MRLLLRDARHAVAVRNGGIALDVAGGEADHARHHRHGRRKGGAVALPLVQQKPGDEIPAGGRHVLRERIRVGAAQIGAERGRAVKIRLRVLRDLPGQRVNAGFNAVRQRQIVGAHRVGVSVAVVRGGQHGLADSGGIAAQAEPRERVAVAEGEAARAEDLAGRGKIRHDFMPRERRKALGEVERAGRVGAHEHGDGFPGGELRANRVARAFLIEQIAAERVKARIDIQIAPAGRRIRPSVAVVFVFDRAAKQRAPRGANLHHRGILRVGRAAELRDAERLVARRAERKGRARVGEKEIVVEHPADALGKLIQFRRNLRGKRHEQRRRGQNGGAQRHDAPRPNAGRAAAEQQRENQRQQRRGADLRAEKRDDEQQRDFKQRQREKRLFASGERRANARKDEREQQ